MFIKGKKNIKIEIHIIDFKFETIHTWLQHITTSIPLKLKPAFLLEVKVKVTGLCTIIKSYGMTYYASNIYCHVA